MSVNVPFHSVTHGSPTQSSPTGTRKYLLRVVNTLPTRGSPFKSLMEGDSLVFAFCKYAGSPPREEDVPALAIQWACIPVEYGAITIPMAVYMMKPSNENLWDRFREKCGCRTIIYTMTYLRYTSTGAWIYSTRQVPVGTSCSEYHTDACTNFLVRKKS